jgi:hypothetical protein
MRGERNPNPTKAALIVGYLDRVDNAVDQQVALYGGFGLERYSRLCFRLWSPSIEEGNPIPKAHGPMDRSREFGGGQMTIVTLLPIGGRKSLLIEDAPFSVDSLEG